MAATMTRVFPAPSPAPGVQIPCVAIGPEGWLITFWVRPVEVPNVHQLTRDVIRPFHSLMIRLLSF